MSETEPTPRIAFKRIRDMPTRPDEILGLNMALQDVPNFILDKLKEALHALQNLAHNILAWFDHIFPPDTRSDKIAHWFHLALPYLVAALIVLVLVCLCRCCYKCCCRGRRGAGRMMKAPGRNVRMPRSVFEADPKGYYFRTLRSHPGDILC